MSAARRLAVLVALLLGVEALDELYSGVPSVGSADIQADFVASYTLTAGALLFIPGVVALIIEPILFVLADRYPRKWFVCGGLFGMGVAGLAAAAAPNVYVLSLAIAVAWVGSGSGVALAQATLVDARPNDPERALARWALLGEVGDLAAPALMAGVAVVGMTWRAAYVVVSVAVLLWAVALLRAEFPTSSADDDEEDEPSVLNALRTAVGNRTLVAWLGAAALCDLLDEIVVVFATLHLRENLAAGSVARSVVIGAAIAGAIVGVIATEWLLLRVKPIRLLLIASVGCAISYAAWIACEDIWLSGALFFVVGVTAAPMYPIVIARAYAALPGRSGTVNAAGHLYTPLILGLPWVLGLVADHIGLRVTLAILLIQPIGLVAISALTLRKE